MDAIVGGFRGVGGVGAVGGRLRGFATTGTSTRGVTGAGISGTSTRGVTGPPDEGGDDGRFGGDDGRDFGGTGTAAFIGRDEGRREGLSVRLVISHDRCRFGAATQLLAAPENVHPVAMARRPRLVGCAAFVSGGAMAVAWACSSPYDVAVQGEAGAEASVAEASAPDVAEVDATSVGVDAGDPGDGGEPPCSPGQTRMMRRTPRRSEADSGITFLGGGSTGTYGPEWSTPGAVAKKDGVTSSVVLSKGRPGSMFLITQDYGFQVPSGATIRGIRLVADATKAVSVPVVQLQNGAIGQLFAMSGAGASALVTGAPVAMGGELDTWSRTWKPAEINAAGFAAVFTASAVYAIADGGDQNVSVDEVAVEVFYDCPP